MAAAAVQTRPLLPPCTEIKVEDPKAMNRYHILPQTLTWRTLEVRRLKKLGLGPNRLLYRQMSQSLDHFPSEWRQDGDTTTQVVTGFGFSRAYSALVDTDVKKSNSLAPFHTTEKPTCGYFFTRGTDNRKVNFGIPASDLVKWRSTTGSRN